MTGAELIAQERTRQLEELEWTPEHDDQHTEELALAAASYVHAYLGEPLVADNYWPWEDYLLKTADQRRCLEKAGALIAAELDRLTRQEEKK